MIELDRDGLSQGQQIADLEKQGKVYGGFTDLESEE